VRGAIAAEAGRRAGLPPAAVVDLVRVASVDDVNIVQVLVDRGVPGDVAILAASQITGLPPAPRLLLRNPQVPDEVDAVGVRDAGGVPIGHVQGRLWIAFVDPEAAKASVFSDDVVVCLSLDEHLREARARFDASHPASEADTQSVAAITPAMIEAFRREQAAKRPTRASAPIPDVTTTTAQITAHATAISPTTRAATRSESTAAAGGASLPSASAGDFDELPTDNGVQIGSTRPTIGRPDFAGSDKENSPTPDAEADPITTTRLRRAAQLGRLKRFTFERVLGSGGMATVYLASDRERPGQKIAVKLVDPQLADDPLAVARFKRELRALMALNHPHVVALVDGDVEADEGVLWLACRYLDGGTLRDLMQRTGALPAQAALPIFGAIIAGIANAHGAGVIHRDMKPQNILLGRDGALCIADFGAARAVGDEPLTTAGSRFGTPAYMSPEQALGGDVDARGDLFSAGIVLYHLLAGENPFVRATPLETMRAIAQAEVPALPPAALPPSLRHLLAALLASNRDARPPDAEGVLRALRPFLEALAPADGVVRALLRDPRAYVGYAALEDLADRTYAEDDAPSAPAGAALQAVLKETHSAFGAAPGALATRELPRVQLDEIRKEAGIPTAPSEDELITALQENPLLSQPTMESAERPMTSLDDEDAKHDALSANDDDEEAALKRRQRRELTAVLVGLGVILITIVLAMAWALS